jgi:endonuclease G
MKIKFLFLSTIFFFTATSYADFNQCLTMFPKSGVPKVVTAASNAKTTRQLCFDSFAVLYSVNSKTPVYTVEKLNYLRVGKKEPRTNHFHEEPMLSLYERSTLKDYVKSGYDRGHMAPAGDMPNSLAMEQSFSLANMIPQSPKLNRGVWAKSVETATRKYVARSAGDIYVFTGPFYNDHPKTIGMNKVWVPDAVYKLVYDSGTGRSWAFWLDNKDDVRMSPPITYQELVKRTGIKFLD